jgi:hypothetical protein
LSSPRARLLPRLLLTLVATLLAFAAVELGVRLIRPQADASIETPKLLRGGFREPGVHPNRSGEFSVQVHVNRERFVDHEWGAPSSTVPRVLVIGDSFVEAAQVELEQGFGRVLQAALTRERGAPVEVLSLGVPGAGTTTALGLLEQYAPDLQPDLVVLGLLVSNDVLNNHPLLEPKRDKPFFRLEDGHLIPTTAERTLDQAWRRSVLWPHSHAWRLLARTVVSRRMAHESLEAGEGMPIDLRVHDPAGGVVWDEAWALTDALVGAMAQRCAARDVSFATVVFPSQVEATTGGRQAATRAWPALAAWDLGLAPQRAAALAAQHGPALDLTPVLSAADGEPPLYYPVDGHWTPRGHRLAAEGSAAFLARLLVEEP